MSRRTKWIVWPVGGLALLAVVFVLLFDWRWVKGIVEDQASSALGRPVSIGDLDVDLGLVPTITVRDVRVANADWASDQPMANVPSATVEVDLMALIGGEIVLPRVAVDQPHVLLEQGDGRANWQFGDDQSSGGTPSIPVIDDLEVTGAEVRYVDRVQDQEILTSLATVTGQAPREGEIRLVADGMFGAAPLHLQLTAGSREIVTAAGEATPFALEARLGSQTLMVDGEAANLMQAAALDATVKLDGAPPDDLLELLGLEQNPAVDLEAEVSREGETLRLVRLAATVGESDLSGEGEIGLGGGPLEITGQFQSDHVDVDQLKALWTGGDPGMTGETIEQAKAELEKAQAEADGEPAAPVEKSAADVEETAEGDLAQLPFSFGQLPPWSVDVAYQAGTIQAGAATVQDLQAQARLEDKVPALTARAGGTYADQPITLDVQLGPAEGAPASPYPVEARIETGATRLSLDGGIEQPAELEGIDVRFEAASEDLGQLLGTVGIQAPAIPAFQASGHLVREDQVLRIDDFQGQAGESSLQGSASLDRSGGTPELTARLTSERLLATDLMPGAQEPSDQNGDDAGTPFFRDGRLQLEALPDINVDVEFEGQVVEVPEFHFEPLRIDLRIVDKIPFLVASGQGSYRDTSMQFDARLGNERYLENSDVPYPVDVQLSAGENRLVAQGTVADPSGLAGLDVDVDLEGTNLDRIGDVLQISLPSTPPYALAGHLTRKEQTWTLDGLNGRVGDSDLDGRFSIDLAPERPTIRADLHSGHLDLDDLAPLVGAPPDTGEGETAAQAAEQADVQAERPNKVLPTDALEVSDLKRMDARVTFRGDNVESSKLPIGTAFIELYLENGKLRLEPVRFGLAGGTLEGTIVLDATPRPIEGTIDIAVRDADFQGLLKRFNIEIADIETQREGRGTVFGRTRLEVAGNSIAEMLGQADGQFSIVMDGGRINALIVEAVGLDIGEALGLLATEGEDDQADMIPVNCLVADFEVNGGVMESKALVLDTNDSKIIGAGRILLGDERLDLRFKALPRDTSVLTASTPIVVQGSFASPEIEVVTEELAEKGLAAAALGVVLPVVGAVLPFIETGEEVPNNCANLMEQAAAARGTGASGDGSRGSSD